MKEARPRDERAEPNDVRTKTKDQTNRVDETQTAKERSIHQWIG